MNYFMIFIIFELRGNKKKSARSAFDYGLHLSICLKTDSKDQIVFFYYDNLCVLF